MTIQYHCPTCGTASEMVAASDCPQCHEPFVSELPPIILQEPERAVLAPDRAILELDLDKVERDLTGFENLTEGGRALSNYSSWRLIDLARVLQAHLVEAHKSVPSENKTVLFPHDGALVDRLRWRGTNTNTPHATTPTLCREASDRIEQLEVALRSSAQGWENVIELGLVPPQHMATAAMLRDQCKEAVSSRLILGPEKSLLRDCHEHLHKLTAIIPGNDSAYGETTDLMQRIRSLVPVSEQSNSDVPSPDEERELTEEEMMMVDLAWETHKAALPVATVIDDNQPGRTAIIKINKEPPTLGVGTKLYAAPVQFLAAVAALRNCRDFIEEAAKHPGRYESWRYTPYTVLAEIDAVLFPKQGEQE